MFCKWCGGSLTPSDSKCKRCGKEVPALSDCGGFYDLVPDTKQPPKTPPADGHRPPCEMPPSRDVKPEVRSGKTNKRATKKLSVLPFFGAIVVLVIACIIVSGRINQCTDEVKGLRNELTNIASDIDAIEARLEALEEIESDEVPNTTPDLDEPVISQQDVSFSFKIAEQRNTREYIPDFDLGECDDDVSVSFVFGNTTNETVTAVYAAEKAGEIGLGFTCGSDDDPRTVAVTYRINEAVFGVSAAPETCNWEYRVGPNDSWHPITEELFSQTETSGQSELSISEAGWQDLIGDNAEALELRCKIYRTNTDGGSMTFLIEGIRFHQELNAEISTND